MEIGKTLVASTHNLIIILIGDAAQRAVIVNNSVCYLRTSP